MKRLGCWKDEITRTEQGTIKIRALENAEGQSNLLNGAYKSREDAIKACYDTAVSWDRTIFALQDGGQCFTEAPQMQYDEYGESSKCGVDGKGGPLANEVYEILSGNHYF